MLYFTHPSLRFVGIEAFDQCSSLTDVCYGASQKRWNEIEIGQYNDPLLNAVIHFSLDPAELVISSVRAAPGDTVTLTVTQYDTVHDTVYDLRPQVRLTVVSGDAWRGLVAGNATVPAGTMIEVAAIPLEGSRFEHWSDGETANPRRVTVETDMTLTASFVASTGVEATEACLWRTAVEGRHLTVECAAGETVRLFDTQGRCLAQLPVPSGRCTTVLPSAGVFLVGVGTAPAKKNIVE